MSKKKYVVECTTCCPRCLELSDLVGGTCKCPKCGDVDFWKERDISLKSGVLAELAKLRKDMPEEGEEFWDRLQRFIDAR